MRAATGLTAPQFVQFMDIRVSSCSDNNILWNRKFEWIHLIFPLSFRKRAENFSFRHALFYPISASASHFGKDTVDCCIDDNVEFRIVCLRHQGRCVRGIGEYLAVSISGSQIRRRYFPAYLYHSGIDLWLYDDHG